MKLFKYAWMAASLMLLSSCEKSNEEEKNSGDKPLFSMLSPEESGIAFNNTVENQKDFNIFKYRNFYNGGGVAIGDINNDGLADIYLTANMGANKRRATNA